MNTTKIERIKAALKQHIAEAEKAADGPWVSHDGVWDFNGCNVIADYNEETNAFIAEARTMSPAVCSGMLRLIERLQRDIENDEPMTGAEDYLAEIEAAFPEIL